MIRILEKKKEKKNMYSTIQACGSSYAEYFDCFQGSSKGVYLVLLFSFYLIKN